MNDTTTADSVMTTTSSMSVKPRARADERACQ